MDKDIQVDFTIMKRTAIEKGFPEPAFTYIQELPDKMGLDDFFTENKVIARLLRMSKT